MIRLNRKLKSGCPKVKTKLPKIEINECKMKTRDQKKLENEMFQQAKEAQILLEKLLSSEGESDIEDYGVAGRARSNSLNATMENLLLSRHKADMVKNMKPRGSVPNIAHISRKLFFRHKDTSPRASPLSSPESSPRSDTNKNSPRSPNRSMNPLKLIRKHQEANLTSSESHSPMNKRAFEPTNENATCTNYKQVDYNHEGGSIEILTSFTEKLI